MERAVKPPQPGTAYSGHSPSGERTRRQFEFLGGGCPAQRAQSGFRDIRQLRSEPHFLLGRRTTPIGVAFEGSVLLDC
jgi:hypothetical protein